jgi:hypothetical protein
MSRCIIAAGARRTFQTCGRKQGFIIRQLAHRQCTASECKEALGFLDNLARVAKTRCVASYGDIERVSDIESSSADVVLERRGRGDSLEMAWHLPAVA